MKLDELLQELIQGGKAFEAPSVFWVKGVSGSSFFSYLLAHRLAATLNKPIQPLSCEHVAEVQAKWSVSFLGQTLLYWLTNVQELALAERRQIELLAAQYRGPHQLIVLSENSPPKTSTTPFVIDIENKVSAHTYALLSTVVHQKQFVSSEFHRRLFDRFPFLSLESACMLVYYQEIIGQRFEEFFACWIERIGPQEHSLFELSKIFFAKEKEPFMQLWDRLSKLYPPEFWIAYWSDQVWQALGFIDAQQQGKILQSRLPYGFVKQGWRAYRLEEFINAHTFLYSVDYRFKHTSISCGMDLFCWKFVMNEFATIQV